MKTEYGIFGKNNSKISTPRRIHRVIPSVFFLKLKKIYISARSLPWLEGINSNRLGCLDNEDLIQGTMPDETPSSRC